jgi:hypothetical protein
MVVIVMVGEMKVVVLMMVHTDEGGCGHDSGGC